jgi:hypothetical protein
MYLQKVTSRKTFFKCHGHGTLVEPRFLKYISNYPLFGDMGSQKTKKSIDFSISTQGGKAINLLVSLIIHENAKPTWNPCLTLSWPGPPPHSPPACPHPGTSCTGTPDHIKSGFKYFFLMEEAQALSLSSYLTQTSCYKQPEWLLSNILA